MQTINVGYIIRELRTERGMTQKELADKMNISDKTVSKMGTGFRLSRCFSALGAVRYT